MTLFYYIYLFFSFLFQDHNVQNKKEAIQFKGVRLMVFNVTLNNIPVILWSALFMEETGVSEENHQPVASHWQTLSLMLWVRILIRDYLCNQCLSPLMLWVRILIRTRCTTLCDKVVGCSCVVVKDYGKESQALDVLHEYFRSKK